MMIRDMFADDINRKINGVIKVDQAADDVIEQELNEYVITRELKKHFITFFNYYGDAFDQPTADMGVWISGFFGSGKSHFLKMLSYLLENKEVKGIRSVERFRKKFEDDPATFMLIDRAIKGITETILFNIDIEGFSNKDKTAVLRVFAKMFYNHLGFYGENLKVAMMERYIDQQGKTEEFRRVFEPPKTLPLIKPYEFADIKKLWKSLDADMPKYNCGKKYPNSEKAKKFFELFNVLSFDPITKDEIIKEANSIPDFIAKPLCQEAMKLIENLETPKNEDELYKQFRYISRIALREGIYPSAFYLLLIDEFSKLK